ncbi:MAG: PaeR7I family type II restriction endonuclease [Thermoplasmata archaeon]
MGPRQTKSTPRRFADDPSIIPLAIDPRSIADAATIAVRDFWTSRKLARDAQEAAGRGLDRGTRSEVTSGKALHGFARLVVRVLLGAGLTRDTIYVGSRTEVPGYFRAEKDWDLLVVRDGKLVAALELKSQVGSFGNNFNNRVEEAVGSATDLRNAIKAGSLGRSQRAWLGYLMLLQDDPRVRTPVRVQTPHYPVEPELVKASYMTRYVHFCRRLQSTGLYSCAAVVLSPRGETGRYSEPAADLGLERFLTALSAVAGESA